MTISSLLEFAVKAHVYLPLLRSDLLEIGEIAHLLLFTLVYEEFGVCFEDLGGVLALLVLSELVLVDVLLHLLFLSLQFFLELLQFLEDHLVVMGDLYE